ncbi:MAG: repair protein, partial [Microbacteriaceae bacterium]|nr:repair protein [Microbacteriaceae bacterium]
MTLAFQPSLFDELGAEPRLQPLAGSVRRIPLGHGAWVDLRPEWLLNSDLLFERLAQRVPWKADKREMYERVVDVPRLVSWFGSEAPLPDPVLSTAKGDLNRYYRPSKEQAFMT